MRAVPQSLAEERPSDETSSGLRRAQADRALEPPPKLVVPSSLPERLALARQRLRHAAENGIRIRVYEVALDLDMSEFHFARQYRAAFGCSPHVYYDEVRAAHARGLLARGCTQGQAARLIGLRRPAELRALLAKRRGMVEIASG